jgi:hypothetical protein
MSTRTHYVYAIVKKDPRILIVDGNGICFNCNINIHKYVYIGYTNNFKKRKSQHCDNIKNLNFKKSLKLYNRLRKHGIDAYDMIILRSGLTLEEAKSIEIDMIAKYKTFEFGLNSTPGGENGPMVFGEDHWSSRPINIHNNKTSEVFSFGWLGGAAKYLDINFDNVAGVLYGSHSDQTFSIKHDAFFQVKCAFDDTPWIDNMPTPNEKRMEYGTSIIVMDIDTRISQEFDSISKAARKFDINTANISAVLSGKANQFLVNKCRYDVQYTPPTRDWNYDILHPHAMMGIKNREAVIAYDEDDILIYDFISIDEAADNTKIARSNINMSALHDNWYAGKKDGKWLRWEYKDPTKRAMMPERPQQKKKLIKLYYIGIDGFEHGYTSIVDAAKDTRGSHSLSTQKKYINLSLDSNGNIMCKANKIWYKK